ncbi:Zn-dependent peptidase ImmA (M78 family) [Paramicrobacterium agarici]|nr:Zn-dependent peptidase ImmA (M78 family) [Microbacterium agarici]
MPAPGNGPAAAARAFRDRHGLGDAPIADIVQIIEDYCGAFVVVMDFPKSTEALTLRNSESGQTLIAVGTTDNYERQRFSLAHELGHLESGYLAHELHAVPDHSRTPEEHWADEFARHLLIPVDGVKRYLSELEHYQAETAANILSDVVRAFGVSPKVALIQLINAGILSRGIASSLENAQPAWTSRRLSRRFGWASERERLVNGALTPKRPVPIARAAIDAYTDGRTTFEAVAHASGARNLEAFERELAEDAIAPPAKRDQEPEWEPDDLSDLLGETE